MGLDLVWGSLGTTGDTTETQPRPAGRDGIGATRGSGNFCDTW